VKKHAHIPVYKEERTEYSLFQEPSLAAPAVLSIVEMPSSLYLKLNNHIARRLNPSLKHLTVEKVEEARNLFKDIGFKPGYQHSFELEVLITDIRFERSRAVVCFELCSFWFTIKPKGDEVKKFVSHLIKIAVESSGDRQKKRVEGLVFEKGGAMVGEISSPFNLIHQSNKGRGVRKSVVEAPEFTLKPPINKTS
jgi:hypothetical protein